MGLVEREISDGKTLNTIKKFLLAGVIEDGKYVPTKSGAPQGGVISPLISNIVLNHLDWTLYENGYKFVRYADDFVVLAKTHESAEEALSLTKRCIEEDFCFQNLFEFKQDIHTDKKWIEFHNESLSKCSKCLKCFKNCPNNAIIPEIE